MTGQGEIVYDKQETARFAARIMKKLQKQGGSDMKKYECPCGYVYDEQAGDPEHGIAPGTKWEDVPADFVCPVCGLDKSAFSAQ